MKLGSLIYIAFFNAVALILAGLVYDDRVYRINYWHSMGFTTTTTYYPFFYITAATKGVTAIPGTLTLDWLQVILVVAAVVDAGFVLGLLRQRREGDQSPNL